MSVARWCQAVAWPSIVRGPANSCHGRRGCLDGPDGRRSPLRTTESSRGVTACVFGTNTYPNTAEMASRAGPRRVRLLTTRACYCIDSIVTA